MGEVAHMVSQHGKKKSKSDTRCTTVEAAGYLNAGDREK
jgi:hypothetical protein